MTRLRDKEPDDWTFRDGLKVLGWGCLGLFALGAAATAMGVITLPFTAVNSATAVVSKTLDPNNVIQRYEWFHDANGNYEARVSQVRQFQGLLKGETDRTEASRLRIEMAAIQQSCRELARRYNANAEKVNVGVFRGWSLPQTLSPSSCE